MPLIFSPLSDDVIAHVSQDLFPKHAFVMRQIGSPPGMDRLITDEVSKILASRGYGTKDADASTGAKDFLSRILDLMRGTAITVAIFTGETRSTAMSNIMLELGFAAMCGKPLMIVKSSGAPAPSDLTRTDWIDFDPTDVPSFQRKLGQALDEVEKLAEFEEILLDIALEADTMDCSIALERALRCFLLTGSQRFIDKVEAIRDKLAATKSVTGINDLNRTFEECALITRLGRKLA